MVKASEIFLEFLTNFPGVACVFAQKQGQKNNERLFSPPVIIINLCVYLTRLPVLLNSDEFFLLPHPCATFRRNALPFPT